MNIAVLGAGGMLGRAVVNELSRRSDSGVVAIALTHGECDIINATETMERISTLRPRVVINCAAFTDVNGAESREDEAQRINATGAGNVARAAAQAGARCFYVSTDYVFDGTKPDPYLENDSTAPINAYGRTKLEGELRTAAAHPDGYAIFRTSWLYGHGGKNFVDTMLRLGSEQKELRVVNDQAGAPTCVTDLARLLADCAFTEPYGIYHATSQGACTWYEFAAEIFRQVGREEIRLVPVASSEFPTPARRPANSRLANTRLPFLGVPLIPHWKDALAAYLTSIK